MQSTYLKTSATLWSLRTTVLVGFVTSTLFLITFYLLMQVLMTQQAKAKEVVYNAIHNDQALDVYGEAVESNHFLHFKVHSVHPVYEMILQQSDNGKKWRTVSLFNNERLLKMVKSGSFVHHVENEETGYMYRTMMRCKSGWLKSEVINLGQHIALQ